MGEEDEIQPGDVLSVYRGESVIGKVQIDEVSERVAAASILSLASEADIREDDFVAQL